MGLVVPRHVGSSQTRDQTHVSHFGRQILYHRAAKEAQEYFLNLRFCTALSKPSGPHNSSGIIPLELKVVSPFL